MSFNEEEYAVTPEEIISGLEDSEKAETEEAQYTEEVWSKAMQRIEEANLFKLLIKDSIFSADSANPVILNAVNKKIKAFAIRELENLLGIPNEKEEALKLPFDKEEVTALKALASTMLKRKPQTQEVSDKTPKLNQITTTEVSLPKKPMEKRSLPQLPQATKPQIRPQVPKSKKPNKPPGRGEFAQPVVKPAPMPKADQLIAKFGQPAFNITAENNAPVNPALLGQIVGQLTKNTVHIDQSVPDSDSANEKF